MSEIYELHDCVPAIKNMIEMGDKAKVVGNGSLLYSNISPNLKMRSFLRQDVCGRAKVERMNGNQNCAISRDTAFLEIEIRECSLVMGSDVSSC